MWRSLKDLTVNVSRNISILKFRFIELYVKGRKSYFSALIFIALLLFIGNIIKFKKLEFLNLESNDVIDLTNTLLSNYIGVLSLTFAVSAIILSFIQIANKKYQILELLLNNSYFAFTFYFGLINIVIISTIKLFFLNENSISTNYTIIRLINCQVYLFIIFSFLICLVFYYILKFINVKNLNELFLSEIQLLAEKEYRNILPIEKSYLLNQRSNEMINEMYDCIERNDRLFLERSLKTIIVISINYPNSNILIPIKHEIPKLYVKALKEEKIYMYNLLLEFWRSGMTTNH